VKQNLKKWTKKTSYNKCWYSRATSITQPHTEIFFKNKINLFWPVLGRQFLNARCRVWKAITFFTILSANLECRSEMCCMRLAKNTRRKNSPKIRHLGNIARVCRAVSSQIKHVSTIGKKLIKQQYLLHTSSHYGELPPTNGWDQFTSLQHPSKFQRVSRLAFVTAATSLTGGQPNLARRLVVSWAGILSTHFRGLLPLTEFCPVQTSLYVQVLRSSILAALLHGTPASGVSQTLWRGIQGMELRNFRRGPTYIRLGGHQVGHRPTF